VECLSGFERIKRTPIPMVRLGIHQIFKIAVTQHSTLSMNLLLIGGYIVQAEKAINHNVTFLTTGVFSPSVPRNLALHPIPTVPAGRIHGMVDRCRCEHLSSSLICYGYPNLVAF